MFDPSLVALRGPLDPNLIDLGYGYPDPALLPVEAMQRASAEALRRFGSNMLSYGANAGPTPLLDWLRVRLGGYDGRTPAPDEVMTTPGNSGALDQLLTLFTQPGDVILVESPTYHLAIRVMRDRPLELATVAADEGGLRPDALDEAISRCMHNGKCARALYCVPTFNNPTGASLDLARRKAIVDIAARAGILIFEDDVYRELTYDAPAPPSLWSLDERGVVLRMGSFSKTLATGLRVGWLTAHRDHIQRIVDGGLLDSGGGHNHFAACVVAALCESGEYETQVDKLRAAYRERRDALLDALQAHLPAGCVVRRPGGGFFVWIELPDGTNTARLLLTAEAHGMSFLPGSRFFLDGGGEDALRLCFTLYAPEALAAAASRLGNALRATPAQNV
jgi:DNA-binding transcriptional MocR family regulator